jgi:hypothetical protein
MEGMHVLFFVVVVVAVGGALERKLLTSEVLGQDQMITYLQARKGLCSCIGESIRITLGL